MRRGLCALVLLSGLALPVPVRAATPQVVAARASGAAVAIDGAGNAFLVSTGSVVNARSARPGRRFGPPRTLMRSHGGDRAVGAGVAADGSGVIVVQRADRRHRRVGVVVFDAHGRVGVPVTLSPRGERSDVAAAAVARSGAAVVVWFGHRRGGRWRLEAAVRDRGSARFGPPAPISAFVRRPCCTSVSVAIGERGDAVAAWTSTLRPAVWASARSPGHGFRGPQRLATGAAAPPSAVVGAGGMATILYSVQHVPLRATDGLQLHRAPPGGAFGAAEHVNPGGGVTPGAAGVTPDGRVVVAWVSGDRVRVAQAAPAAPLAPAGELGAHAAPTAPAVAAGDDGRAVVAWTERASTEPAYREQAVAAARAAPGAPFGAATALGSRWRSAEPSAALLARGAGALVLWKRGTALVVTRLR